MKVRESAEWTAIPGRRGTYQYLGTSVRPRIQMNPHNLPELQPAIALYCEWVEIHLKHGGDGVQPEPVCCSTSTGRGLRPQSGARLVGRGFVATTKSKSKMGSYALV